MMTDECEQREVIFASNYCCSKHSVLEHMQQKPYS